MNVGKSFSGLFLLFYLASTWTGRGGLANLFRYQPPSSSRSEVSVDFCVSRSIVGK